jgi:hypothetical protein
MCSPVLFPILRARRRRLFAATTSQSPLLELSEDSDWRVAQAQWVQGTVPRRNRRLLELTHGAGHDIYCPQRPEVRACANTGRAPSRTPRGVFHTENALSVTDLEI